MLSVVHTNIRELVAAIDLLEIKVLLAAKDAVTIPVRFLDRLCGGKALRHASVKD